MLHISLFWLPFHTPHNLCIIPHRNNNSSFSYFQNLYLSQHRNKNAQFQQSASLGVVSYVAQLVISSLPISPNILDISRIRVVWWMSSNSHIFVSMTIALHASHVSNPPLDNRPSIPQLTRFIVKAKISFIIANKPFLNDLRKDGLKLQILWGGYMIQTRILYTYSVWLLYK